MRFKDASKVLDTIQAGDEIARVQGSNRARINNLFNGAPPLEERDAKNMKLSINVNFGEAPVLGQHGRRQYNNAFLSRSNYFKISIPDAPPEKAVGWSTFITRKLNRYLKRSRCYYELHRSQWASTLLHGMAPKIWYDGYSPLPKYVALSDFRVPTDSLCSMENVNWFAVRKYYTEGELSKKVWGTNADAGWKKDKVKEILNAYHDVETADNQMNWAQHPEKMAEMIKQNGGFYSSDAVPTIPLWHFFFLDDDDPRKSYWKMRVVPDQDILGAPEGDFLFDDGDTAYAECLDRILHVQFGDLNNDAPFKIHSVRSLGFLLMEPVFWSNLTQCRFLQHVFEHMNIWLRSQDPAGRARAQLVDLFNLSIVPEGVTIVPQTDRPQIDPQLVEMVQGKLKELQNEASVSYTQDTEGRKTDETATAVMARVSAVNAMMSGLLATAYNYEVFAYEEICRRFCLSRSPADEVRRFQKDCLEYGIPRRFINVECWDVEPEIPLGAGNPTMEMARAKQLLEMRPMYDPTAQQEILHEATVVYTDDPKKADRWVPIDKKRGVTDAQEHAELAFSTLMLGVPVRQREGLAVIDQIETLIGLIAGVIARIEQTGNMATAAEIRGLNNSAQYTGKLIEQLGQDENEKPRAKQFSDALGKLMNAVKGFQQRLQQAQEAAAKAQQNGNGHSDPRAETAAKLQGQVIMAQSKSKISEEKAAQTQRHKDFAFASEQRRRDAEAVAEMQREGAKTHEELQRKRFAAFNSDSE
jgi:hypothetical protein